MKVPRIVIAGILAVATTHLWVAPTQASSASAQVRVQVTIRPWIKFSMIQPTTTYKVTAEDIRRGHIDLPQAVTVDLQTNIREEIRLDVSSTGPEQVLVKTGATGSTDTIMMAGGSSVPVTRVLDMRIVLPSGISEGAYPLNIAMAPVAY